MLLLKSIGIRSLDLSKPLKIHSRMVLSLQGGNMSIPILGQGGQPADQGTYTEIKDDGPKIRLLYCYNCKTIEELPDFEGNPDDDVLLQVLVEKHESAGVPHTGFLAKIGAKTYSRPEVKKQVIENLRNKVGGGLADIDPDYYTTKATFYDDAMKCYNEHRRPKEDCGDWRSKNKRLVPKNTAELRKEVGLMSAAKSAGTNVFLCDFCPVKTHYVTQQRKAAKLYEQEITCQKKKQLRKQQKKPLNL